MCIVSPFDKMLETLSDTGTYALVGAAAMLGMIVIYILSLSN